MVAGERHDPDDADAPAEPDERGGSRGPASPGHPAAPGEAVFLEAAAREQAAASAGLLTGSAEVVGAAGAASPADLPGQGDVPGPAETATPAETAGPGAGGRAGIGRLIAALGSATLLQWLGAFAIAPVLPLYLEDRNVSAAGVGMVMSAFFIGALLAQYPAGRAVALHGHRVVLVAGLAAYTAGCLGLAASPGLAVDTLMRMTQGAGAGAFEVAVLTAVAVTVPQQVAGRAFSVVFTGQLTGMAVGPLLGGLAGEGRMDLLFLAGGGAALAASLPVLTMLGPGRPAAGPPAPSSAAPSPAGPHPVPAPAGGGALRRLLTRGVVGLLLVAACNGLASGTYEACWSLLLADRGVSTEVIGLTYTFFALPYIIFALPAGWLADRADRRWLVLGAVVVMGLTAPTYPYLPAVWLMIALSWVEAVAMAMSFPSAQSLLAQEAGVQGAGRAQGLFTTVQTGSTAAAALAAGALYEADIHLPFVTASLLILSSAAVLPLLWRKVAGVVPRPSRPSRAGGTRDLGSSRGGRS